MHCNQKLKDLYIGNIPGAKRIVSELGDEVDFVSPLLMRCWEKDYDSAKVKILYCGQETNGWHGYLRPTTRQSIEKILDAYEEFNMGRSYNSIFWQYVHRIHRIFNPDNNGFAWTNIIKFGKSDMGRPDAVVQEAELKYYNLLKQEISILAPDMVIFFTGPNYDADIAARLRDVSFENCSTLDARQFALVKSVDLPCPAIRTYHPGYLNRNSEMAMVVLSLISKQIQSLERNG